MSDKIDDHLIKLIAFPSINNACFHILLMKTILKVHYCRFENLAMSSSSCESNMLKIPHYSTFYFLRYAHLRYVKSL